MSDNGWQEFLDADGVGDWVGLHGGPTAVFRVDSLTQAVEFADAVSQVSGLEDRALITLTATLVTIKLTREMWHTGVEQAEVASAISVIARDQGLSADRSAVHEVQVAIAAKPDAIDLGFWRTVLGYSPMHEDNAVDPLGQGSTVWMQDLDPAKQLRHAMHLDVSLASEHAESRVQAAVAAGGVLVDESGAPGSWILADRAGNKVCVAAWPDGAPLPGDGAE